MYFSNNSTVHNFLTSTIDSITFIKDQGHNVYIDYDGSNVWVTNPLAGSGVDVVVNGTDVTVTSTYTTKDVNYILAGTSTNGSFKIYSDLRFNLLLNYLHLTNNDGPVINIQSKKKATIHLINGASSSLADGVAYGVAPIISGIQEDQKAALFSESQLEFIGGGSLNVTAVGSEQHGIASDNEVQIKEGTVVVLSSVKDGVHGSDGYFMKGGSLTISGAGKDGIDAESGAIEIDCGEISISSSVADINGIVTDSIFTFNGGTLNIVLAGDQSKGIKTGQGLTINDGALTLSSSGNTVMEASGLGYDPAYSKLLSSDENITIIGGILQLTTTGMGGRSISADGNLVINGGTITINASGNGTTYYNSTNTKDSYHSTAIKTDGMLEINEGTVTITNSGTGGKCLDSEGVIIMGTASTNPAISLTTTGNSITITASSGSGPGASSGDYDESKTVKASGDITVNNGEIDINSKNDGIKSAGTITVNNGNLTISQSTEAMEAPFITVNGGNVHLSASDDGFNATHGTVSGGTESNDGSLLKITNGYVVVSTTGGDGMDSNGSVQITGGTVLVHGPQSSPELGLDYNGTGTISGGTVVISGPGQQMLQGFGTASTQKSLILKTSTTLAANTLFHVMDNAGNKIFTFKPVRNYQTIVFSSPSLVNGTYKIYTTGTDSGTVSDGYYSGGVYTPGTLKSTFNITGTVSTVTF